MSDCDCETDFAYDFYFDFGSECDSVSDSLSYNSKQMTGSSFGPIADWEDFVDLESFAVAVKDFDNHEEI